MICQNWFSPARHDRAFSHGHTGLAFPVHFGQQFPERGALRFRAVVLHRSEADFFGGAEMSLHERGVECGWKRIGSGTDFLEPCALQMRGEIGRPPV